VATQNAAHRLLDLDFALGVVQLVAQDGAWDSDHDLVAGQVYRLAVGAEHGGGGFVECLDRANDLWPTPLYLVEG
jgi:hypothetical protein